MDSVVGTARAPLALISDSCGFLRGMQSSVLTSLSDAAALLGEHAGMATTVMLVTAGDDQELVAELRRAARHVCGVYLARTATQRSHAAQDRLAGELPIITDLQTTATAVIAAATTALSRAGIPIGDARMVITGNARNPLVAVLAAATGIGEITRWGLDDAQDFPLRALFSRVDVVIDLLGISEPDRATLDAIRVPIIAVDDPVMSLLALPILLGVALAAGRPPRHADLLAAARALVDLTPPDRLLPQLVDTGACGNRIASTHPPLSHPFR